MFRSPFQVPSLRQMCCLSQALLAFSPLLLNPPDPDRPASDFPIGLSPIQILPPPNHGILLLQ